MYLGLERVLSPVNGVVVAGEVADVKKTLISLREDPVYKEDFDSLYRIFLKERAGSGIKKIQNCILSIL